MIAIAKGLQAARASPTPDARLSCRATWRAGSGRRLRRGLRRPRHRGLLRRARPRRRRPRRRRRRRSTRSGAARCRSTSRASTSSSSGTASALRSRPTSARRSRAPSSSTSPSARRRPTRATPTSPRSGPWSTSSRAVDRRIVVAMKSTVPVGTGEKVRHRLDERGLAHVGYVSNPEFTAEGTAVHDFMQPDRIVDRRVRRRPTATSSRRSTTGSTRRSSAATSRPPR